MKPVARIVLSFSDQIRERIHMYLGLKFGSSRRSILGVIVKDKNRTLEGPFPEAPYTRGEMHTPLSLVTYHFKETKPLHLKFGRELASYMKDTVLKGILV